MINFGAMRFIELNKSVVCNIIVNEIVKAISQSVFKS